MKDFYFYIDILGTCNLSCPSCPVGNSRDVANPKGLMALETLEKILQKATGEARVTGVGLFNWTEPMLHPKLPDFVRLVKSFGVPCHLSSNLNSLKKVDELMAAGPDKITVSVSGFTQPVYGRSHRGGDIEKVKQNMRQLAQARDRAGAKTYVDVTYHRYLDNLHEEAAMTRYAKSLGFAMLPVWAKFMPFEKAMTVVGGNGGSATAPLTEEDRAVLPRLALPVEQAAALGRRLGDRYCPLQQTQVTLDWRGHVALCCAVFDMGRHELGSYLDKPLEEIQRQRQTHATCTACLDKGLHQYFTRHAPDVERLALRRVFSRSAAAPADKLAAARIAAKTTLRPLAQKARAVVGR